MSKLLSRLTALAVSLGMLAAFAALPAQAGGGSGPGDALTPDGAWHTLPVGGETWYAFQAAGDKTDQITIRLTATPQGSANFAIWSPDNLLASQNANTVIPIGRGNIVTQGKGENQTTLFNGDPIWISTLAAGGTYYIVVDQVGGSPSTYMLSLSGTSVAPGLPAGQGNQAANNGRGATNNANGQAASNANGQAANNANANGSAAPQTLPATGNSPAASAAQNYALENFQGPQTLRPGEQRWFTFQHAGWAFQDFIQMSSNPQGAVQFSVWTPETLAAGFSNGNTPAPVGRGTAQYRGKGDDRTVLYNGDLIWTGAIAGSGTYHVQVVNTSANPATFQFKFSETLAPEKPVKTTP